MQHRTLTPSQAVVLAFIRNHIAEHGEFPTGVAITRHAGWSSPSTVGKTLDVLADYGLVRCLGREPDGRRRLQWEMVGVDLPPIHETTRVPVAESSPPSRHIWPDQDIALASKLWRDGFSGSEISARFGGRYSRSAVIVKMAREGVKSPRKRGDSTQTQARARKKCKPRIVVSNPAGPPMRPTPIPPPQADDVARVSFNDMDFDRQCNFPVGDVVPSHVKQFCGLEQRDGPSPYCETHHRRCFDPLRRRPSYTPPTYGVSIGLGALNAVKEFETV